MGPFEMVVAIVGISAVAKVASTRRGRSRGSLFCDGERQADGEREIAAEIESDRLRGEVRELKERIQVLEAIVTDGDRNRSLALEREIEALRHYRPRARPEEARP